MSNIIKIYIIYDMADFGVLKELGLSKTGIRCYVSLLEQGPATARRLSERLEIPHTNIYGVLKKLTTQGFVDEFRLPLSSSLFRARPLDHALRENYMHHRRLILELCRELGVSQPPALPPLASRRRPRA